MRERVRSGVDAAASYARSNPNEARWSIGAAAASAVAGFAIGGVGIAAMSNAKGAIVIVVMLVLAIALGLVGNRVGIWFDRRGG